ncbi:MAG TPA: sulfatase [Planctomicrobium sp.]|nr:sulfatase [Planctomicrobium sp.]
MISQHHLKSSRLSVAWGIMGLALITVSSQPAHSAPDRLPNIVLILTDDQGYADVGCFGAQGFETPHLDQMAREGRKLTSFYVSQAVCGASRASLLTGCYANRIGMLGAPNHKATHGIHPDEILISELCRQQGYATAIYGKWHLGHHQPFLPLQNGFDDYFGLPYSNDMWPHHPTAKHFPNLPLISGNDIINPNVTSQDQTQLTTWYTERAIQFIRDHQKQPFFLYVAHAMPHVPLHVSEKFAGRSQQGTYGDVMMEIDWSVGQILQALDETGLRDQTLVIFTSDNGPWLSYGNHAGSATPLREGKGTSWEGGVRVPCIVRWPGKIPAGTVCDELAATIDVLPTVAKLIGAPLPNHPIDGKEIWSLLSGEPDARTPHSYYCFFWGKNLEAIRSGDWKLHFPHPYRSLTNPPGENGLPNGYTMEQTELALFNLQEDPGEKKNLVERHPEVVQQLQAYADEIRADLGTTAKPGPGVRPPGQWMP